MHLDYNTSSDLTTVPGTSTLQTPISASNSMNTLLQSMNSVEPTSRHSAFVLGNPPLAALHTMTENKVPNTASLLDNPFSQANGVKAMNQMSQMTMSTLGTPHSISDILSRNAALNQLQQMSGLAGNMPRLNAAAAANMYFNSQLSNQSRFPKPIADLPGRSPVYWPGVIQGAPFGRSSNEFGQQGGTIVDKDGKRKHTRPTFSGQQIFALEKTFEQTKYLAGPERARLAYALGMSESQVKVWFQNRRTKWRKKHAAEMATAKRKQDQGTDDIDSDDMSEEFESCRSLTDVSANPVSHFQ
ncbi:unnamed protein product [Owenia fusiformis]|uniref:NK6 n=1 Tax=Owenia fusiformis TaxID=6347 RepID=A0A2I6QBN1_OWEFU|nr:NK6 [Owenia fusiformis]CAH1783478.1 unnamed protein product [Owenia fusiformis]